jgi:DNA-binding NarL/FixJ family response regulator
MADLLILSDIRFIREGLAEVLGRDGAFQIAGSAVDVEEARELIGRSPPRVILVDTALPKGIDAVSTLRQLARDAKIVAFALKETEAEVIAWAQAGIYGYIPRDTPLAALVGLLNNIIRGEQASTSQITSMMLRWIARHAGRLSRSEPAEAPAGLTVREQEVGRLIGAGLSNKEIARRLGISLATTKSHVHNILAKVGVGRRALAANHLHHYRDTSRQFNLRAGHDAE